MILIPTSTQWRKQVLAQLKVAGLSQAALARRLGLAPPQVSDWLTGKVAPSLDSASRVTRHLDRMVTRALQGPA